MADNTQVIKVGKYEVTLLKDVCIGAATCVAMAPDTFELDENNIAVMNEETSDLPDTILMAAQACPVKAIIVKDIETGEQLWPA